MTVGCAGLTRLAKPFFFLWLFLTLLGTFLLILPLFSKEQANDQSSEHGRRDLWLVLLICLLGVLLRVLLIGVFPPPDGIMVGDEAISGLLGWRVLNEDYSGLFAPMFTMAYPTALSFYLFDYSIYALRIPFVIAGIITLPLLFPFARIFFNRQVAFLALFLFASCRWHNMMGRMAIDWIHVPLLCLLCFHCFWRGIFTSWRYFVLNGLFLGIALLSYYALRIIPVIQVLTLAYYLLITPLSARRRIFLVTTFAGFAAIFALPGIFAWIANPTLQAHVASKYQHLYGKSPAVLLEYFGTRAADVLRSFWDKDHSDLINAHGLSMVDPVTIIFAVLGFLLLLPKVFKDARFFFLWLWLGATLVSGGLLVDVYRNHRLAGIAPLLCLTAAFGMMQCVSFGARRLATVFPEVTTKRILLMTLCSLALFLNLQRFLQSLDPQRITFEYRSWRPALCARVGNVDAYIYDMSRYGCFGDWRWLTGPRAGRESHEYLKIMPHFGPTENVAYALSNQSLNVLWPYEYWQKRLSELYLEGKEIADDIVPLNSVRQSLTLIPAHIIEARRKFKKDGDLWSGSIFIPVTGSHTFAHENAELLTLDGRPLRATEPVALFQGWHAMQLKAADSPERGLLVNGQKLEPQHIFSADLSSGIRQASFLNNEIKSEELQPDLFYLQIAKDFDRLEVSARIAETCENCELRLDTLGLRGDVILNAKLVIAAGDNKPSIPLRLNRFDHISLNLTVENPNAWVAYRLVVSEAGRESWHPLEALPRLMIQ